MPILNIYYPERWKFVALYRIAKITFLYTYIHLDVYINQSLGTANTVFPSTRIYLNPIRFIALSK